MTIAELHGKLSGDASNASDRLEDLLTSDVFGSIQYAEAWPELEAWLLRAMNADGDRLADVFHGFKIARATMRFWPGGGRLRREPDLAIAITSEDGTDYGFCIEAKYLSGKSNRKSESKSADEPTAELAAPSGDQLAEEWQQMQGALPKSYGWPCDLDEQKRALIFVTAHAACPRRELVESVGKLRPEEQGAALQRCFWLGWCDLHCVLRHDESDSLPDDGWPAGKTLLLRDLYRLLDRKGLKSFRGYADLVMNLVPNESGEPWQFCLSGSPRSFTGYARAINQWRDSVGHVWRFRYRESEGTHDHEQE